MSGRRVAVIGAGPGGLYAATLIGLAHPDWQVSVHEHNADGQTFGFGVGLTASTLRTLDEADVVSGAWIRSAGQSAAGLDLRVGDGVVLTGGEGIAIGRATLLELLRKRALEVGVRIETAHVETSELDADLVVAADGVRSGTREKLAAEFGARIEVDDHLYLWAGTDFALDRTTFAPAQTPYGTFVVHAYPYGPDRSTFLVETDDATWRAAGLQAHDTATAEGNSDEASLTYLSEVFGDLLGGRRLLGNRTRWQRFATISCARWSHGDVALIGDAAHTAHYSIGSGTKLALEDAIELAAALRDEPDQRAALERYEAERRPRVERFQAIAGRSHLWWKAFPRRVQMPPAMVMASFMTRAGNISIDDFAALHPDVVADAAGALTGERPDDAVAADPDALAGTTLHGRVREELPADSALIPLDVIEQAWGPAGTEAVARSRDLVPDGGVVWLTGTGHEGAGRAVALARCDLAERVRLDTGALVGVDLDPAHRAVAVGALLSGRIDLVRFH